MTFQFKLQLRDIEDPVVWRRINVPAQYTFYDLHEVIQVVMGWEDRHMFKFTPKGWGSFPSIEIFDSVIESVSDKQGETLDATKTKLNQIFKEEGDQFYYIYDFGDSWEHEIILEKIFDTTKLYPACIEGVGVCPPEDCGGVPGFENLKEILKDKDHPEYDTALEWCLYEDQEEWDPEFFNLEGTQAYLMEVFTLRSGLHN